MKGSEGRQEGWISGVARRLAELLAGAWRQGELVAFHTTIKLELLACSPAAYRALGRLVAIAPSLPRAEVADAYARGVRAALALPRSRGRDVNALQHAAGFVSTRLDDCERRRLHAAIDDYAAGRAPRTCALGLVRRHARRQGVEWLLQQVYLDSSPRPAAAGGAW